MNTSGLLPHAATADDLAVEYGITKSELLDMEATGLRMSGIYYPEGSDRGLPIYSMTDLLDHAAKDTA
ncbi:hypothetical protein JOJ86_003431 [Rhodococcus percolatus]|uniref:hypothetical protein n=1 Tax=Rhodococcus opacus TaxID=37919 RepID=UPI0015F8C76C|nr:hypothetical protein [Rhodococcus opacus]MBA8960140.1 hypothetical protein [Rhodococcus opacus]MBP2205705.1 hypothetical protein [Rhodococcus opacus]